MDSDSDIEIIRALTPGALPDVAATRPASASQAIVVLSSSDDPTPRSSQAKAQKRPRSSSPVIVVAPSLSKTASASDLGRETSSASAEPSVRRPKARRLVASSSRSERESSSLQAAAGGSAASRSSTRPSKGRKESASSRVASKVKGKQKQTVDSDDDDDDFFTRKPKMMARKPKVSRQETRSPSVSHSDRSASYESDVAPSRNRTNGAHSPKRKNEKDAVKPLKLPDWTRQAPKDRSPVRTTDVKPAMKHESRQAKMARLLGLAAKSSDDDGSESDEEADEGKLEQGDEVGKLKRQKREERKKSERELMISDDDDDATDMEEEMEKRQRKAKKLEKQNRKKKRKSRSPTPPVEVGGDALLAHLYSIGKAPFQLAQQAALPTLAADDGDGDVDDDLDPALAAIAASMAQRSWQRAGAIGEEEVVRITLSMVSDPKPTVPVLALDQRRFEAPIMISLGSRKSFSVLFDHLGSVTGLPASLLVVTYNDKPVYSYGTPDALRIRQSAEFKGYTLETYNKIQSLKLATDHPRSASPEDTPEFIDEVAEERDSLPQAASTVSGQIRLTLRGSATDMLSLAVKPSTTISTLMKQYCKKLSVPAARMASMWIELDGEKLEMESKIGDTEVEDEETLEVKERK